MGSDGNGIIVDGNKQWMGSDGNGNNRGWEWNAETLVRVVLSRLSV